MPRLRRYKQVNLFISGAERIALSPIQRANSAGGATAFGRSRPRTRYAGSVCRNLGTPAAPFGHRFSRLVASRRRARCRRRLTIATMAERMGGGENTYSRLERGDPTVAMGAYAMALFVLGFGGALGDMADVRRDDVGLQLDEEHLPKRVHVKKSPTSR